MEPRPERPGEAPRACVQEQHLTCDGHGSVTLPRPSGTPTSATGIYGLVWYPAEPRGLSLWSQHVLGFGAVPWRMSHAACGSWGAAHRRAQCSRRDTWRLPTASGRVEHCAQDVCSLLPAHLALAGFGHWTVVGGGHGPHAPEVLVVTRNQRTAQSPQSRWLPPAHPCPQGGQLRPTLLP